MPGVRAGCSTRLGGVSQAPFDSLNLAEHVGDEPDHVRSNRDLLSAALQLPGQPQWLKQVHGTDCVDLDLAGGPRTADAALSHDGRVCAVMTADCLPVLLAARDGSVVAAVHAGWRGLQAGVIEQAVRAMRAPGDALQAWLGPAIGPRAFEVGAEVLQAFTDADSGALNHFRASNRAGHWLADLPALARRRLRSCGVNAVYGGDICTHSDADRFFSYRRDGRCGRMVSLIWQSK